MSSILVATDFSPRSDRALRRAVLAARQMAADLVLFHAMGENGLDPLRTIQRDAYTALLMEMADTITNGDGVSCSWQLSLGNPFQALTDAARELNPDIVMMGSHRRRLLKDIFFGTTAERTIRECPRPVIVVNGVPAGPWRRVLIATDFSIHSLTAARVVEELGLLKEASVTVLHVFDVPQLSTLQRSPTSAVAFDDYFHAARDEAAGGMRAFVHETGIKPYRKRIEPVELSVADTIRTVAGQDGADLIVVATHGRADAEKFLLGSVAGEVLRAAACDVLTVPPGWRGNRLPL